MLSYPMWTLSLGTRRKKSPQHSVTSAMPSFSLPSILMYELRGHFIAHTAKRFLFILTLLFPMGCRYRCDIQSPPCPRDPPSRTKFSRTHPRRNPNAHPPFWMGSLDSTKPSPQWCRRYPLYSRGMDKKSFDIGVFLLNKNLEQV